MLDKINKLTRKIAIRPTLMVSQGRVKAGDFLMAPKMRQALQICKRKNMLYDVKSHSELTTNICQFRYCYETNMFGRVIHTLDAAAMRLRSSVYIIHIP